MIKQGLVQETLSDLNSGPGALPPLHNLPQWSRVNTLDKARYPKPFLKDRLQPLGTNPLESDSGMRSDAGTDDDPQTQDTEQGGADTALNWNPAQRVQHLEKSLNFLRQQHQDVLSSLHEEIDKLKRENKDMQFKIVMIHKGAQSPATQSAHTTRSEPQDQPTDKPRKHSSSRSSEMHIVPESVSQNQHIYLSQGAHHLMDHTEASSEQQSQVSEEKLEELKIIFLEEELKELKKALREEKNRNHYLAQMLDRAEKQMTEKRVSEPRSESKPRSAVGMSNPHMDVGKIVAQTRQVTASEPLPFNATLEPLQVQLPLQPARPPTMKECQVIMQHLQQTNDKQAHELNQLKSDLRDVLYSHKWTPDAYLLAKAYIAEDDAKEAAEHSRLPRIPLRQSTRKLPDIAYVQKDALSLPALKQTVGNKAVERRKRTQVLQRARLHKEVLN